MGKGRKRTVSKMNKKKSQLKLKLALKNRIEKAKSKV